MKPRLPVFVTIALLWCVHLNGQHVKVLDSLNRELKNAASDTLKVGLLNQIAFEIGYSRNEPAIDTARIALNLARENDYKRGVYESKGMLGKLLSEKGEMDSAMIYLNAALQGFEEIGDEKYIYNIMRDMATLYLEVLNFDQAKYYYEAVLTLAQKMGDPKNIGNAFNGLGSFYIQKSKSLEDSVERIETLKLAEPYFERAVEQFELVDYERGKILCIANMAWIHNDLGNNQQSLDFSFQALDYFIKNNYQYYQAISFNQIAETYLSMGQYGKSLEYAKKFLEISGDTQSYIDLRNCYGIMTKAEEGLGNFRKALDYQKLYNKYENMVVNEESQNRINELEAVYQTNQREKEIQTLNAENQLRQEKISRQRTILISSFIVIALILALTVILYYSYRLKKRDNEKLNEQKQKISRQNAELLQKNQMIKLQNEKIKAQNERLTRLYEEHRNMMLMVVHDLQSPFNKIKGLCNVMQINGHLNEEQKDISSKIEHVADHGRQIITELTNASFYESEEIKANKQPVFISQLLKKIHREHETYANKKDISFVFKEKDKDMVVNTDSEFLTRILDNLISNAIKYSPPRKSIYLSSWNREENFFIEIKDQGPGISKEDQDKMFKKFQKLTARPTGGEHSTGLGLNIVKTLTDKLDGEIAVESELGKGTSFILSFPISKYKQNEIVID